MLVVFLALAASSSDLSPVKASGNFLSQPQVTVSGNQVTITGYA
jgi:hypothetical protein